MILLLLSCKTSTKNTSGSEILVFLFLFVWPISVLALRRIPSTRLIKDKVLFHGLVQKTEEEKQRLAEAKAAKEALKSSKSEKADLQVSG